MKTLKDVMEYLVDKAAPSELTGAVEEAQDVLQRLIDWGDHMGGWEAGGAFGMARGLPRGEAAVVVYDGKGNLCDNCQETWDDDELEQVHDLWERVEPGGVMPSGECPDCGALCYPVKGGT